MFPTRRRIVPAAPLAPAPRAPVLAAPAPSSLYWAEKLFLLVLALQAHALLLRAVTFPPQWRLQARWALLFALDVPRFLALGRAGASTGQGVPQDEDVPTLALWAGSQVCSKPPGTQNTAPR